MKTILGPIPLILRRVVLLQRIPEPAIPVQFRAGPPGASLGDWSVGGSIVTGLAARRAVVKAILAEANVDLALAKAAVFFAAAFVFSSFALHTHVFLAGTGA